MRITKLHFFDNSVRCFFPLAALSAVFGPAYLVTVIINQYPFAHPFFTIFEWHGFEMLFGFLLTLVAGFILTAGGHWTGRGPLKGKPLIALFLVWFLDKIALFLQLPSWLYIVFAALFPLMLLWQLSELLKGYRQYWRFLGLISFLCLAKLLYLFGALYENFYLKTFATKATIFVVTMLIAIIGGRVIPVFTRNFFGLKHELTPPKKLEVAVIFSTSALFIWVLPHGAAWLNGLAFILAGSLNMVRTGFYLPFRAIKHPILGMLQLGYVVFSLGLILFGLTQFNPALNVGKSSLHFLATGGFSIIAINIMTRASLGHTGRPIKMTPAIGAMFACIVIGAFLRGFIPPIWPELYFPSLHYSMGFWTLGFIIYLIKFLPIVFRKRADAK